MAEITDSLAESVQDCYGTVLSSSEDLQTSACCAVEAPPDRVRDALKRVHPEVLDRFYGCGSPLRSVPSPSPRLRSGPSSSTSRTARRNYGQVATSLGTIPESPDCFELDERHVLETGQAVPVSGNTAAMLSRTRYARHVRVEGDTSTHHGPFDRATVPAPEAPAASSCC